jgi:uncharacterized membrane protein YhhN
MIRPIQAKGLSALAIATAVLFCLSFLIKDLPKAVPAIILWAGFQSMMGFYALLWALPKSNEAFFSIFVGEALLRVLSLGVIAFLLYHWGIGLTIPLITLATVYLFLSLLQIPYFHKAAV